MTDRTEYWARKVLALEVQRKSAEMALDKAKSELHLALVRSGHDSIVVDGWRLRQANTPTQYVGPEGGEAQKFLARELAGHGLYGEVFSGYDARGFHALVSRLAEENGGVIPYWLAPFVAKKKGAHSVELPEKFHAVTADELSRRAKAVIEAEPGSILPPGRKGEAFYDEDWYPPKDEDIFLCYPIYEDEE